MKDSYVHEDIESKFSVPRSLAIAPTVKYIVPSKFLVALITTGTSTLKVVAILVPLKAKVTEEGRWRSHRKGKC